MTFNAENQPAIPGDQESAGPSNSRAEQDPVPAPRPTPRRRSRKPRPGIFKIKFLPARFGDCIWIEYGAAAAPHRILIDGGTSGTRREIIKKLEALPAEQRRFELLVVSHIDRDHIEGILSLLEEPDPGFQVNDLWFNGWKHLPEDPDGEQVRGSLQGERLTGRIQKLGLPWNAAFGGGSVSVPASGPLPRITLPGGLELTLLSPTVEALIDLRPAWEQEVRAANLVPGFGLEPNDEAGEEAGETSRDLTLPDVAALAGAPFEEDDSLANASSIALLAEFEGRRALLAADEHADIVLAALERLSPRRKVPLDLFKVSHHGSKFTTNRELIEKVDCLRYVFSTNGSIFHHPDRETVARVIESGGSGSNLAFNYRSRQNEIWDLDVLKQRHNYSTRYPVNGEQGVEIEL